MRIVPVAADTISGKNFSIRLSVLGGPATTLRCQNGILRVFPNRDGGAAVNLLFFSARQLNRLFTKSGGMPPLPVGVPWQLGKLRTFVALTNLLDRYLQPSADGVDSAEPGFKAIQTRLLLRVLSRAAPLVAQHDPPSAALLAEFPESSLELQAPTVDFTTRFWAHGGSENGAGSSAVGERQQPAAPADATIVFRDAATLEAALHGRLDAAAAVGLGRLDVRGWIPLADAWSYVLDRVEVYLQPKAAT